MTPWNWVFLLFSKSLGKWFQPYLWPLCFSLYLSLYPPSFWVGVIFKTIYLKLLSWFLVLAALEKKSIMSCKALDVKFLACPLSSAACLYAFLSVSWSIRTTFLVSIHPPVGQQRHKTQASINVSVVGREMCSVGMAIGECLTWTNIIYPGQYPKMANYTDQLAG